jgi:hypothetical protein
MESLFKVRGLYQTGCHGLGTRLSGKITSSHNALTWRQRESKGGYHERDTDSSI